MNKETIGYYATIGIVIASSILFSYLFICGLMDIMPFSHKKIIGTGNISCGTNELQIAGYCCETQEQYNSGDCTKK